MLFLLGLFLTAHATVVDPDACNIVRDKYKNDCLKASCLGLLDTGTEAKIEVRDGKKCDLDCEKTAVLRTSSSDVCAVPPLPPPRPTTSANGADPQKNPPSKTASQKDAQTSAVSQVSGAEGEVKAKQAKATETSQLSRALQKDKIQSSEELLRRWDKELSSGKSRVFPADRAKWKNDKALVEEAERAREKNKAFPAEKANQASLPAIRGNLNLLSSARQIESDSTKNLSTLALTLAQLAQMKKTGQANLKALDQSSVNPVPLGTSSTSEQKKAEGLISSALEKDAKSDLALAPEKEEEKSERPGSNSLAPGAAAAGARSTNASRENLRARLRELLQKKMAAEGLSEMPEQFLGELGIPLDSTPGDHSSEEVADPGAEEEIFRLAGADTDTEIQRLRAELQDELARSVGVLPEESMSLFERVKAAYLACAARKCVVLAEQMAGKF